MVLCRTTSSFLAWFSTLVLVTTATAADPAIDFEKQIAPILIRSCLDCHNATDPKGELDLTHRKAVLKGGESGTALVSGKPAESLLLERIEEGSMPPEEKGKPLSKSDVNLFRDWIQQGAVWPKNRTLSSFEKTSSHRAGRDWWSLQPVVRPSIPDVKNNVWLRNSVDAFVLNKLEQQKLSPAAEADRITFLRRAKFDLLGLPPTPDEVDAFVADVVPGAHARLVDQLLASPHYGERWGRHWLDVVRYTESDGFEHDKYRPHAWRYRDYVIQSLNADKPYTQFVKEQLAGDVLPKKTRAGIAATGFLVAGPWNEVQSVGASKIEMSRAHEEQMEELIGAVSQSFLGMTLNCARCHDHKFDPVPIADYYRMKAVFDGVDHSRKRIVGNQPILTPREMQAHRAKLAPLEAEQKRIGKGLAEIDRQFPNDAVIAKADPAHLITGRFGSALNTKLTHAKTKSKTAYHTPPLTVECWVRTNRKDAFNVFVANNLKSSAAHWELYSYTGKGDFSVYMPGYTPAEIRSGAEITDGKWHYLAMQFDGKEVRLFVDGKQVKQQPVKRTKTAETLGELVFGGYEPPSIGCDGAVDEVRISNILRPINSLPEKSLTSDENTVGFWKFDKLLGNRFADQSSSGGDADRKQLEAQRSALNASLKQTKTKIASHVIPLAYIGFRNQPAPTHVLLRGDIATPGELVTPRGPQSIPVPSKAFNLTSKTPEGERRLRFAEWIASRDNPLTARVMVNRLWQQHFGMGLVKTPSDFGFNGGRPSHPQLLDWLADEFIRSGWSLKQMHRLMMLSATYRQSSQFNAAAAKSDADNRLLWRYSPRRLEGEIVRDTLLAVSGDLNPIIGGSSYKPFTVTVFNTHFYHLFDSDKPEYNRRTVYRANVITGRDPLLDSFDCPVPAVSAPKRRATVTPLQALSLMNDSFVLRQADRFAKRILSEAPKDVTQQTTQVYRHAFSRVPSVAERQATEQLIQKHGLESACWVLLNSSEFLYVR